MELSGDSGVEARTMTSLTSEGEELALQDPSDFSVNVNWCERELALWDEKQKLGSCVEVGGLGKIAEGTNANLLEG